MTPSPRPLGDSGISVYPIGLGGMPMSLAGRPPEERSIRVILAALEAGVDLIDTADVYCADDPDLGHNERLIARALREWRGHPVHVATKGGMARPDGRWVRDGHPDQLRRACERSLVALGVDVITLYQLHVPDLARAPYEDIIGALADLRAAGKIRHVGLSNVSAEQIDRARAIVPIVSVQNRCNPLDRGAWADGVIQRCEALGLAFLPYSPVGGSRERGTIAGEPALRRVGERLGATPQQVALAWLLARSPVMIPIPGASRVESATESAAAARLRLGADDLAELDAAYPITGGAA
ncbi:MAG: aldo/keto reductase [Nannocystaceae bacterium]